MLRSHFSEMICSAACPSGPARRGTERSHGLAAPSPASDVIQLGVRGRRSSKRQEQQAGQRSVRVRALVKSSRACAWRSRSSAMSAADAGEYAWPDFLISLLPWPCQSSDATNNRKGGRDRSKLPNFGTENDDPSWHVPSYLLAATNNIASTPLSLFLKKNGTCTPLLCVACTDTPAKFNND